MFKTLPTIYVSRTKSVLLGLLLFAVSISICSVQQLEASTATIDREIEHYPHHLYFTENQGQWEDQVRFMARMNAARIYLESGQLTYKLIHPDDIAALHDCHHTPDCSIDEQLLRMHAFNIQFKGGYADSDIEATCASPVYANYFRGDDPEQWKGNVPMFRDILYRDIYDGIDMRLYGKGHSIKYDLIVDAYASTKKLQLEYNGVDELDIDEQGNLIIKTSVNTLVEQRPFAYQYINGQEQEVPCDFKLTKDGKGIRFHFPDGYDASEELIIDPEVVFSSYTGSSSDNWGFTATYDDEGHMYVGGIGLDFDGYPTTTGAYDSSYAGGTGELQCDIAISKFSPDGSSLEYSTYLGGSVANEFPHSLIVNDAGELYVFGSTGSSNFPSISGSYDTSFNSGNSTTASGVNFPNGSDIIVCRFNEDGTDLLGATFVGGSGNDGLNEAIGLRYNYADEARGEIILDASGNVVIASSTSSSNFPTTSGAFQNSYGGGGQDGVFFRLSADLSSLVSSTYIGGSAQDAAYSVKYDSNGDFFVCGGTRSSNFPVTSGTVDPTYNSDTDAFVVKLNSGGTAQLAGTYLGTNDYDQSFFVELDDADFVYTVGQTEGDYNVTSGVYSNPNSGQYIHKLSNDLSTTEFSTTFGRGDGNPDISPTAFLIDICNRIYVSGWGGETNLVSGSTTEDLPITGDAFQTGTDGSDFYFIVLEEDAVALEYGSFFGGNSTFLEGNYEHVDGGTSRFDKTGIVYQAVCAGCGSSNGFPTTPGVWSNTNNSDNCNLGAIKFDFQIPAVFAGATVFPEELGCAPFTVTFDNTSLNATQYLWDFGVDGATSTSFEPTFTFNEVGTYEIMLIANDPMSCNEADTTFTNVTVVAPPEFDGTFSFDVDCETSTASFQAEESVSYQWTFGDGGTSTEQSPVYEYDEPGIYEVSVILSQGVGDCLGVDTVTQEVEILDVVIADATHTGSGCAPYTYQGWSTSYNATSYQWDFGMPGAPLSTDSAVTFFYPDVGAYTVTFTAFNPESCNGQDSEVYNIYVLDSIITADFSYVLPNPCDIQQVDFQMEGMPPILMFDWDFGDGNTGTGANISNIYDEPGTYTVSLIADSNCAEPDTVEYTFTLPPPPIVDGEIISFPENGCTPVEVNLEGTGNATSYLWDMGDGTTIEGLTADYTYTDVGSYDIMFIATDPSTCNLADTSYTSVEVYGYAEALFEVQTPIIEVGDAFFFTNLSSNADSYLWDFGDGNTSTEENPQYTYAETGVYEVCLTAMNQYDCNDTYCLTVEVIPPIYIGIPNAFSPNNDGLNDILYVEGRDNIEFIVFKVFNRWGEKVFETNDPQIGWDGHYKNERQAVEAYAYTVDATLVSTRIVQLKGNVTLLR